jgi:hypothetical protein
MGQHGQNLIGGRARRSESHDPAGNERCQYSAEVGQPEPPPPKVPPPKVPPPLPKLATMALAPAPAPVLLPNGLPSAGVVGTAPPKGELGTPGNGLSPTAGPPGIPRMELVNVTQRKLITQQEAG